MNEAYAVKFPDQRRAASDHRSIGQVGLSAMYHWRKTKLLPYGSKRNSASAKLFVVWRKH